LKKQEITEAKAVLIKVVSMLVGLIKLSRQTEFTKNQAVMSRDLLKSK